MSLLDKIKESVKNDPLCFATDEELEQSKNTLKKIKDEAVDRSRNLIAYMKENPIKIYQNCLIIKDSIHNYDRHPLVIKEVAKLLHKEGLTNARVLCSVDNTIYCIFNPEWIK